MTITRSVPCFNSLANAALDTVPVGVWGIGVGVGGGGRGRQRKVEGRGRRGQATIDHVGNEENQATSNEQRR